MKRRNAAGLLLGAGVVWAQFAAAQPPARLHRLGFLTPAGPLGPDTPNGKALLGVLAQRGYVPGRNLAYEARGASGQGNRLPQLMAELKAAGAEVVVTAGYRPTLVAGESGLPTVVSFGAGDPVATRMIASLARPGGNITGISDVASELSAKRLSLLKELRPNLKRVAMLWNRDDLAMSMRHDASAAVARSLGITVHELGVREPDDFDGVFEAMTREPPDGILMVSDSLTTLNRKRVFDFANAKRLPAIYEYDFLVRDGGLMSYGADLKESFERAGALVDRIFKGAKPADLPFERPTRYPFVVNLKAAKAIGLEFPPALLARADEVIE